jgi:dinuclear metal center YbgI/SA1388 family protein
MKSLNSIVAFLDEYLKIDEISDNSWNGLQFEGKQDVEKVTFAVDAGLNTFNKAVEEKSDVIIVHHGHFWKSLNPSITTWNKTSFEILSKNNISLYASHLPLDRHPIVGNNAQLLKIIGAEIKEEFSLHEGKNIGWIGELNDTPISVIEEKLNLELKTKCNVLPFGNKKIKKVAVCSGGGGYPTFFEALGKKVDLYITGDQVAVLNVTKDAGFNVIFAGHYATETVGVKALSEVVKKEFNLKTQFIDLPTGL